MSDSTLSQNAAPRVGFFERLLQIQLVRFCLVGATSTIIDKGIFALLLKIFGPHHWPVFTCIAFLFAVTNGFYWNRRWTFEQGQRAGGQKQYAKFIVTNLIGLCLNLLLTKGFLVLFLGHAAKPREGQEMWVLLSSICAIPIVLIWNFSASRFWTFKPAKNDQ